MNASSLPAGISGIVVIGRNEGERLMACLASLRGSGCPVVYVDSGSRDGSAERARAQCEAVVELDPARPFSAARARNEGFAALRAAQPQSAFVQFLDGDFTLLPGWLAASRQAISRSPSLRPITTMPATPAGRLDAFIGRAGQGGECAATRR